MLFEPILETSRVENYFEATLTVFLCSPIKILPHTKPKLVFWFFISGSVWNDLEQEQVIYLSIISLTSLSLHEFKDFYLGIWIPRCL